MKDFIAIKESLKDAIAQLFPTRATEAEVIFTKWKEIVDRDVSAQFIPLKIEDDVLVLGTKQSLGVLKGKYLEQKILSQLRQELPRLRVKNIKVILVK